MFKSTGEYDEFNKMEGCLARRYPQRINFQRRGRNDTILEHIITTGDRTQDIFLLMYEIVPPGTTWEFEHVAKAFFKHKDLYTVKKAHPAECFEIPEYKIDQMLDETQDTRMGEILLMLIGGITITEIARYLNLKKQTIITYRNRLKQLATKL